MMSILTGVVLMLAVGMFLQRVDGVNSFFGGGSGPLVLNDDQVVARPGSMMRIDVFANDTGVEQEHRNDLQIASLPSCGHTFAKDGVVEYLPISTCTGEQIIRYSIGDDAAGQTATIVALIQELVPESETAPEEQVASAETKSAETQPEPGDSTEQQTENSSVFEDDTRQVASSGKADAGGTAAPTDVQSDVSGDNVAKTRGVEDAGSASESVISSTAFETPKDLIPATTPEQSGSEGAVAAVNDDKAEDVAEGPDAKDESIVVAAVEPATDGAVADPANTEPASPKLDNTPPRIKPAPKDFGSAPSLRSERPTVAKDSDGQVVAKLDLPTPAGSQRSDQKSKESSSFLSFFSSDEPDNEAPDTKLMGVVVERLAKLPTVPGVPRHGQDPVAPNVDGLDQAYPDVGDSPRTEIALAQPIGRSSDVPGLRGALRVFPLDQSQPEPQPQAQDLQVEEPQPQEPQAQEPKVEEPKLAVRPEPQDEVAPQQSEPNAAAADCSIPASISLDVRRAGFTLLDVSAPCRAGSVARLDYSGLSFGFALNDQGKGQFVALGFEHSSKAALNFANGDVMELRIPFVGIEKISRVALVWDSPVDIELNALEFGADFGTSSHISIQNPRDFSAVRRKGGGFLTAKRSVAGVGQNAQIYTHWHRSDGQTGVVNLLIDYVSRSRDQLAEACGDGPFAAPQFKVLRTEHGNLQRPVIRRLAAENCSSVTEESSGNRLISGAVEDLLITKW